jgi:hypothetical protein
MIWIDEVVNATKERGECVARLKKEALYRENGSIPPTACIEWVAQAFAYVRSCNLVEEGLATAPKAHETLLVGVKNAKFMFDVGDAEVDQADEVRVVVDGFREFGPIIMVHGEVRLPSGRTLMQGNLRVYHGFA